MAVNLATAYVEVIPSMKGFSGPVKAAFGDIEAQASSSGGKSGGLFGGAFGKATSGLGSAIKWGVAGAAGAAGGVAAAAFVKGFNRLNNIDQATAKMKALKMSTKDVESAMASANKAVKGTSFGLDEAAGAAAMASAAGVKLGTDMDRYLKIVADSAAVGGSSLSEMGAIFGKVAATGKLDGEVMAQLLDRQIGILPALADKYHVTSEEAAKMVSDGKVSFEDFQSVMEGMVGGGAEKMGKTFSGSMANMNAALGRLGAKLLAPVFNAAPPVFDAIGKGIDSVGKKIEPFAAAVGDKISGLFSGGGGEGLIAPLKDAFGSIQSMVAGIDFGAIVDRLKGLGEQAMPVLKEVGSFLRESLGFAIEHLSGLAKIFGQHAVRVFNALKGPLNSIGDTIKTKVLPTFKGIAEWARGQLPKVAGIFKSVREVISALSPVVAKLVGLIAGRLALAFKVLWTVIKPVIAILKPVVGFLISVIGVIAKVIAGLIKAIAPVVTWLLDKLANPLKSIFSAIGAVVTWLWQNVMLPAWTGIKAAVGLFWDWLSVTVWPLLKAIFSGIGTVVMWLWNTVFQPAWNGIKTVIAAVWGWISGTLWPGLKTVFSAIGQVAMWLWQNVIVPAWDGIKTAISVAHDVIAGVIEGIKGFFQGVADKAGQVKDWVVGKWNELIGFFKELPGKIGDTLARVWDGLKDGFKAALNWIIDKWNNFKIPAVKVMGKQVTPEINFPDISPLASGGRVRGPGGPTDDRIPAMLSDGEYVVNAAAVSKFGYGFMDAINAGRTPIYRAEGGPVGRLDAWNGGGGEANLKAIAVLARRLIHKFWPQITDIGGYRASDPYPDHPSGQALDIMLSDVLTGDAVKAWLMDNKDVLSLNYTIWQQKYEPAEGGGNIMEDRGSPTQNHMDHIHALFGQIGSPPQVDVDVIPPNLKFPPHVQADTPADSTDTTTGTTDTTTSTPADSGPQLSPQAEREKKLADRITENFGNAAKTGVEGQLQDALSVFSIGDSPPLLAAYNKYLEDKKAYDESTKQGSGTSKQDQLAAKQSYEQAQLARKRKYEDDLAAAKAEYDKYPKAPGAKTKYEDRKRELKRQYEDDKLKAKQDYEQSKLNKTGDAPADGGGPTGSPTLANMPKITYSQSGGAEQWRPLMKWAIGYVGKGLSAAADQVDAGVKQIDTESGGDPGITQQVQDVNSGTDPALGLLQVIGSTFTANRDPRLPDDRTDPAANIVAALRYYVGKYGTNLTTTWGHGHGYARGGWVRGLGTSTSDSIRARLSDGEFVLRAAAARRAPLLAEAINSGRVTDADLAPGTGSDRRRPVQQRTTNVTFANESEYWEREKNLQRLAAARGGIG
ncbi:tape measure protein [Gordonia sp. PP30]|uniref:tape measure protein n=1 Tax=Gordonia sp. PP30 TaxID=2935861 RepID=UPI0020000B2A|nr:tape measure protein [Gordonia sp. PP30]UQE73837.1 tape measure protein [Gordonia sp. PP30]